MSSQMKWARSGLAGLMVVALLLGNAWAAKPVKPPPEPEPEPDPPPVTYSITWLDDFATQDVAAINSDGDVVGVARTPENFGAEPFAFVYTPAKGMVDVNRLLPADSNW